MGAFVKSELLVMPFPYSELSAHKRRPVLVLAVLPGNDLIVCQITSQVRADGFAFWVEFVTQPLGLKVRWVSGAYPPRGFGGCTLIIRPT